MNVRQGNNFFGRFKNGKMNGKFWIGMLGDGFLHGEANSEGLVSGNSIAYIYADGETAFLGNFENRVMKKAYAVDVLSYGCDENGLMAVTKFSKPTQDHEFFFEPPTNISFGGGAPPSVQDPYEIKTVHKAKSKAPNSGDGVFALRNMPPYRPVCLLSLYMYSTPDQLNIYKAACSNNASKSDDYRRHCKKYSLPLTTYNWQIELPPDYDIDPLPTLGPKVNHDFRFNNSQFLEMEHPRWGMIQTVTAFQELHPGEEILVNYSYDRHGPNPLPFPNDFPWYWEARAALEKENKLDNEDNVCKEGEINPATKTNNKKQQQIKN